MGALEQAIDYLLMLIKTRSSSLIQSWEGAEGLCSGSSNPSRRRGRNHSRGKRKGDHADGKNALMTSRSGQDSQITTNDGS